MLRNIMTSAGIEDVTVMLFEGGRHEMLNENNRQHVFEAVSPLD